MKWYSIEDARHKDDFYVQLYDFCKVRRQVWLPYIKSSWTLGGHSRIPIPEEIGERWFEPVATAEEFINLREQVCQLLPAHASEIRALPPNTEIGPFLLERTGPACPDIISTIYGYVVRESLSAKLTALEGITVFPAHLFRAVRLNWELGGPCPDEFLLHEPENYILNGAHSPEVAKEMGKFYEVVLPEAKWHSIDCAATEKGFVRAAFEGYLPHSGRRGLVELAFRLPSISSWVRLVPEQPDGAGVFSLVREDVYQVLQVPARWTLRFQEVELF